MEDFGKPPRPLQPAILISTKRKRVSQGEDSQAESQELELTQSWREILGPPPSKVGHCYLHGSMHEAQRGGHAEFIIIIIIIIIIRYLLNGTGL